MGRKGKGISVDRTIASELDRTGRQVGDLQNRIGNRYAGADQRSGDLYQMILDRANAGAGANYSPGDFESYGIMRGFTDPGSEYNAGFKELSETGLWSEQDKANARLKASRTPTAFYTNLKNDMERRQRQTGGHGFDEAGRRAAIEGARAAAEGALDADVRINESVREGRMAGMQGLSGNQRFGASGMQQGEGMALDATQREKLAGLQQLASLYSSAPGEIGQLLGAELDALGLRGSQVQGLIGQQGAEDSRRWQRKGTVANAAGGGLTTAAGGGAGGTGQFMNKPRTVPAQG